jgi:DNA gyrase/topoisomerase IV subunit A
MDSTINLKIVDALELTRNNYRDYGLYVGGGRAYGSIFDGCKSAYKRAIYGMWKDAPRKICKVAELAAFALPFHPHPTSVSGVIVQLGENGKKLKLLKTQGNFGDSSKGIEPSADRYIGGMLSDLAIEMFCDSIEYCEMIPGEIDKPEPKALPALLPLAFINGLSGIPSGLPKLNIPCLDIEGMFDYYLDILKHKDLNYVPKKLPIPNVGVPILSNKKEWEEVLKTGKGTVRLAPEMSIDKDGVITITAMPASKTAEHVRKIIEKEILLDKIDMRDESTYDTRIVIEKVFKKQCDMQEIYDRLYKKLQTSETYNLAFFDQDHIYVPCSFDLVVKSNLNYLIETHTNRLKHQIQDNQEKLEVLQIIEKLKKTNNWKAIFDLTYEDACGYLQTTFKCATETAQAVLRKPISYLTKEHQQEITDLQSIITSLENDQSDIFEMLTKKYKAIKQKVLKEISANTTKFI